MHGTCGKDATTLPWWWLKMETLLLKGEQWNKWELAREEKQRMMAGIKTFWERTEWVEAWI